MKEVHFLHLPGGQVAIMEAAVWSHPRDIRPRGTFRSTSRQRLEQALDLALRDGRLYPQARALALSLGLGPLSAQALRTELLRRFDARTLTAVWIPDIEATLADASLPEYRRGAKSSATPPQPRRGRNVAAMSVEERCREVLVRTCGLLEGDVKAEFLAMIETEALLIGVASSVAAAVVGAFFGITEILALLLMAVGAFFIGPAIFKAAEDLLRAFALIMGAKDDADLDAAAKLISAVLAVVTVSVFSALIAKGVKRARGRVRPLADEAEAAASAPAQAPSRARNQPHAQDAGPATTSAPRPSRIAVSADRRRHILDGDSSGGGHGRGRGKPNKSEFPAGWDDDRAINAIEDVANDPLSRRAPGRLGRTIVNGHRDGLDIEVIIENDGTSIVTGYPTNVPRNPRAGP